MQFRLSRLLQRWTHVMGPTTKTIENTLLGTLSCASAVTMQDSFNGYREGYRIQSLPADALPGK
eukprot:7925518-Pyramimonas_sp.AAC.1